jgi:hypothetical protein
MSGGKRFRFTGSQIAVLTNFGAHSPSQTITGITKANPAVVSVSNHGFQSGDVVQINGVAGMTEVNGGVYIVHYKTSGTFELADTDSTNWGSWSSGGKVDLATFSNFCELTGYNRAGAATPEIDAESLCSTAKEYEMGLPDYGSTTIDFNFAPRTAIQAAIKDYYSGSNAGDVMAVRVTLPNSGGELVQLGFVQNMSEQVGKGGIWTGTMTIRNTGPRYDVPAS